MLSDWKRLAGLLLVVGSMSFFFLRTVAQPAYDVLASLGQVQPISVEALINRTGIRAWTNVGFAGNGVRIGVLHPHFGGLSNFVATIDDDLINLAATMDIDTTDQSTENGGTLALRTISAIAPAAEYYLCSYNIWYDYSQCIDWFLASDVQIIHHGSGWPAGFGDIVQPDRNTDRAVREGTLWINGAGDYAGGTVHDVIRLVDGSNLHRFSLTDTEQLRIQPVTQVARRIMLTWNGTSEYSADTIDLDLQIVDDEGNVIARSYGAQRGNPADIPMETLVVPPDQNFAIQIRAVDDIAAGVKFVLAIDYASVPNALPVQTIMAPGTSNSATTVGALRGNQIAPYSSRGPLLNGAIKPDLVAPGEILLEDQTLVVGSVAASAIVTGAAALIVEAHPTWDAFQLKIALTESTQDDREVAGIDATYGAGRLYLAPPPERSSPTPNTDNGTPNRDVVFRRDSALVLLNSRGSESSIVTTGGNYDPDIHRNLIAFSSARDTNQLNIYVLDMLSGLETQLTDHPAQDRHPSISPDGRTIAFTSNRDGNWEIYRINMDGSGETRLTNTPFYEYAPSWSPDGRYLTYQSERDGVSRIVIHDLQSNNIIPVTDGSQPLVGALWSPNSRFIAAYVNVDNPSVVLIDLTDETVQQMTDGIATGWLGANHILLHRREPNDQHNIYVVNIHTGQIELLIEDGTWAASDPE